MAAPASSYHLSHSQSVHSAAAAGHPPRFLHSQTEEYIRSYLLAGLRAEGLKPPDSDAAQDGFATLMRHHHAFDRHPERGRFVARVWYQLFAVFDNRCAVLGCGQPFDLSQLYPGTKTHTIEWHHVLNPIDYKTPGEEEKRSVGRIVNRASSYKRLLDELANCVPIHGIRLTDDRNVQRYYCHHTQHLGPHPRPPKPEPKPRQLQPEKPLPQLKPIDFPPSDQWGSAWTEHSAKEFMKLLQH